ncbi:MAG: HEPN domain-containing protein [Bacteroidetes bacterium]|nr:HEPN domain-containing protein [Bacteroidota bacterium]MBL7104275.1 HEPN domain-containing protein [Bacteroidales bacterium]
MQQIKVELIKQWLIKAEHDLGSAMIIYEHLPEYKDTITFHCQQVVEKLLKAYLVFLDIEFPQTHSLTLLLDLLSDKDPFPEKYYVMADTIQAFAVNIRYPSGRYDPESIDVEKSIKIAMTFKEIIMKKMNMLNL